MVLLSLASCLEMTVGERNIGMRTWRVGDLGLVATDLRNMRTWRVGDLGLVATDLRNIGMRTWRVGDLGLVATQLRNVGMRAWRVEFALSVTLV